MVNYECIFCKYVTKNKSNHIKHCITKKHLEKVNTDPNGNNVQMMHYNNVTNGTQIEPKWNPNGTVKSDKKGIHACTYCQNVFAGANSLSRHSKSCYAKRQEEFELKDQIKNLNTKVIQYEKDVEYKQNEVDYYKQMLMEAGGLVNKSVSALTFSIKNYNNAPPIKTITMDKIDTFENPKKGVAEDILSSYKHKTLGKYLGNLILKLYKTEDPKNQSIWNTDDSRLTYLIKELLNNKASNWIVDKKGIKTTTYLIDPLLGHIKDLLVFYQKTYGIPTIGQNSVELEMILENSKKIIDLVNDIDDGFLAKEILKYISSHLKFNDKNIK